MIEVDKDKSVHCLNSLVNSCLAFSIIYCFNNSKKSDQENLLYFEKIYLLIYHLQNSVNRLFVAVMSIWSVCLISVVLFQVFDLSIAWN